MESLTRQVEELEALQAVYPEDEGCFVLAPAEAGALAAARAALAAQESRHPELRTSLSGTVRLPDVQLEGQPVSLRFQLPPGYPTAEPPQLSVECAASRPIHEQLTQAVQAAAQEALGGESLMVAIAALQEASAAAAAAAAAVAAATNTGDAGPGPGSSEADAGGACCPEGISRVALWFHHIKSTTKRKHILEWARECAVSGFCKPGFPGAVIAEGRAPDVREYVARIRALQWQAMQVRAEQFVACAACSGGGDCGAAAGGSGAASAAAPAARRVFGGGFTELPEQGMSLLGQACTEAGVQDLFYAVLKLGPK